MPVGQAKVGLLGGIGPGQWDFIETKNWGTDVSYVDFTSLGGSQYQVLRFIATDINLTANSRINTRLSNDGGSTFESTLNYDKTTLYRNTANNDSGHATQTGDNAWYYTLNTDNNNAAATTVCVMDFYNAYASDQYTTATMQHLAHNSNNGTWYRVYGAFGYDVKETIDAIRFYANAGNIDTATISLYGLNRSIG